MKKKLAPLRAKNDVTLAIQVQMAVTSYGRNKNHDDEIKKTLPEEFRKRLEESKLCKQKP